MLPLDRGTGLAMAMKVASAWCGHFKHFCSRLDSNCANLRRTMEEKPVYQGGGNFSAFVDNLNDAVSSIGGQVESLEAMTVNNVSLEEMFGHWTEVYKQNEDAIAALEVQLGLYGYTPAEPNDSVDVPSNLVLEAEEPRAELPEQRSASKDCYAVQRKLSVISVPDEPSPSVPDNKTVDDFVDDDDGIFAESFSLRDLGLSSAALATIADHETAEEKQVTQGNVQPTSSSRGLQEQHEWSELETPRDGAPNGAAAPPVLGVSEESKSPPQGLAEVSEEEFKKAPAFLKARFPLKDLNETIVKLNDVMRVKKAVDDPALDQADLDLLNLGVKTKECVLLLVRLNRLSIERVGDSTAYIPQLRQSRQ